MQPAQVTQAVNASRCIHVQNQIPHHTRQAAQNLLCSPSQAGWAELIRVPTYLRG